MFDTVMRKVKSHKVLNPFKVLYSLNLVLVKVTKLVGFKHKKSLQHSKSLEMPQVFDLGYAVALKPYWLQVAVLLETLNLSEPYTSPKVKPLLIELLSLSWSTYLCNASKECHLGEESQTTRFLRIAPWGSAPWSCWSHSRPFPSRPYEAWG